MSHQDLTPTSQALRHRDRMARKSREQSSAVADIGDIPLVVDLARRERCRLDLFAFLTTYFPQSTGLRPLSDDHRRFITRLQNCVLEGGLFVEAMPRGFAKTTIGENAVMWATLYGHRRFVPVFGAANENAKGNIDSIKMELAENDLLMEDFPEVCHPVRALENKVQRCRSQTHNGKLTHIEWTADTIVLPSVDGSLASGAIITAHGLLGASRGMKYKRPDGTQQRPDFAFIDDPQTDESAASPVQVRKRMGIIKKAVLKSAGHGKKLACFAAVTVIAKDDLADQLLNPKLNPAWQSERIKMVKAWSAAHETLWKQYAEIRNTYNPDDLQDQRRAHQQATDFYRANRAAMDDGCLVSWEHCYDPEVELSAIQHAYNALIDDGEEVFASEYQNEPLEQVVGDAEQMKPAAIAAKLNGLPRGVVPIGCDHLTMHTDIQGSSLWWMVCAWASRFDGYIIDYGIYPDQGSRRYTTLRDIKRTYMDVAASAAKEKGEKAPGLEGSVYFALDQLCGHLLTKEWRREDGALLRISQALIDTNWRDTSEAVYLFCRQTKHSTNIMPAHGKGYTASMVPMREHKKKIGERVGLDWKVPPTDGKRTVRWVHFDTNSWKSFVAGRLSTPMGDHGCISLFGSDAETHKCLSDQLTAEYPVTLTNEEKDRRVTEWKLRPGRDNHWLDNLVGCAVAASMLGCSLITGGEHTAKRKTRPLRKGWG
jgi:hypothetical protein